MHWKCHDDPETSVNNSGRNYIKKITTKSDHCPLAHEDEKDLFQNQNSQIWEQILMDVQITPLTAFF